MSFSKSLRVENVESICLAASNMVALTVLSNVLFGEINPFAVKESSFVSFNVMSAAKFT